MALDPLISNGTCYYDEGKQANDAYIPCGNAVYGNRPCCEARDFCLTQNACYNGQYGVTYLAGCTDKNYNSSVCPGKNQYSTQQWVGLVRCFVSNDSSSEDEQWAPCQDRDQPLLGKPDTCSCTSISDAVFTAGPTLPVTASLPVRIGDGIAWSPGWTPTVSLTSQATTGTFTTTARINTTATIGVFTSVTTPVAGPVVTPESTKPILNTSEKIGIGVGVGGSVLIGILIGLFVWMNRKNKPPPAIEQIRPRSEPSETDPRSPAWSGHKSELPGSTPTSPALVSEYQPYSTRTSRIENEPACQRPVYEMP